MLIYDVEILNAIPPRYGATEPGINYCEGWHDHKGMGIAVIGCYDYATDRYRVFCKDNFAEFGALIRTQECIVGFNNLRFDDCIMTAAGMTIPLEKSYDILQEIWRGLGLDPVFNPQTHGGYSLQAMCQANFRQSKASEGAFAPIMWQRGEVGGVVDYCLHDIHLTKKLLDRIIRTGSLVDPKDTRQLISVRKPGARQ